MSKIGWVLIVEDNDDIRETMMILVAQHGYEPKAARNGQEALSILNKSDSEQPCLILLDWAMPTMSGKEFLEMRRVADVIAPIPVVIVSASPPAALPLGAMKILRKPFDLVNLFKDIDKYCGEALIEKVIAPAQVVERESFTKSPRVA